MKVAAVQMASGPNVSYNLIEAGRLIALAAQDGAELVVLPENFAIMGLAPQDVVKIREPLGKGPIQDFLAEQAKNQGIWIVGGTVPLVADDPKKFAPHVCCLMIVVSALRGTTKFICSMCALKKPKKFMSSPQSLSPAMRWL